MFKRLDEGELNKWLQERRLPWYGGTVPTLDTGAMKEAYPYLNVDGGEIPKMGGGGGGGMPGGFQMPKMPWESDDGDGGGEKAKSEEKPFGGFEMPKMPWDK